MERYGVNDANCSDRGQNPFNSNQRRISSKLFDQGSVNSISKPDIESNQILLSNSFPQGDLIDHKKVYSQLISIYK